MNIQKKISLLLLLICSGLVGLLFVLVQWSFDRGLLDYVNQRQLSQVEILRGNLQSAYRDRQSWSFFEGRDRLWHDMLRASERGQSFDLLAQIENEQYQPRRPRRHHRDGFDDRRPPPRPGEHRRPPRHDRDYRRDNPRGDPSVARAAPSNRSGREVKPPPRNTPALKDASGNLVIGQPKEDWQTFPVFNDDQLIATLLMPSNRRLTEASDLAFRDSQIYAFAAVSLLVLVLSLLVAFPMARHFVRPMRAIMATLSDLAGGNYKARSNLQRTDELGQLNRDINELAQTLETNEQARNRWVAAVAHELRTPLAIARGEIEAMRDGVRPMNDKGLQSLDQELARLHRLSDDLSELFGAELGALRYQKQAVDMVDLIEEAFERHQSDFSKRQFNAQCLMPDDLDAYVWGDPVRLNQLLDNLLHNTVKYASDQAKVVLGITVKKHRLIVSLSDSGPGVPLQAREQLFDYLYRVEDSRNRNTGGSGLGLAICKAIVDAHDGTIKAGESELGGLAMVMTFALLKDET